MTSRGVAHRATGFGSQGCTMSKSAWFLLFGLALSPLAGHAQATAPGGGQTLRQTMTFHGVSPTLADLARNQVPVAPENGQLVEDEMEPLYEEPSPAQLPGALGQPFVQTAAPKPFAAIAGANFEGPGTGLPGFTLTGAPPDMTLAVGPNHIVAWVNSQYAVFSKTGTVLLPPVNGNSLFTGVGNLCETTNRGDPILQYDRLADRWILSQFAFAVSGGAPAAPYFQCFAVSTTNSPTGTYFRYSVQFGSVSPNGLNDYGKLGVWHDGYYTSYNIFGGTPAGSNTGVALCASDRVKMLAGDATATTLCAPITFYAGGGSFLPADLDGTTLPSDLTQGGIFLRQNTTTTLNYVKLKPNFAAGTVTIGDGFGGAAGSFISLPSPVLRACNGTGGTCIAQVGTTNLLDTLGSRLMYRLAFRNRGGVESMVVAESNDPDAAGARGSAFRWWEIRNPLGNPADPVVANRPVIFQSALFDPGATGDRWMGSIAMDRYGNLLAGYSVSNVGAGLKPSIAVAGREASDPLNTFQSEILAFTGTGSQTGTLTRWGDYSTMQVDPVDDATFWYIGQYLLADGSFNWRTRIVSYRFPTPIPTLSIGDVSIVEGNSGTSNAQFTITRSNTVDAVSVQVDTANGSASAGSDYAAIAAQVVNFTAGGSATATVTVPINGDAVLEPDETFSVTLSAPTNATIADGTAQGTITNDDSASIAINDRTLAEGNSGTTNFVFTVSLSGAVQGGVALPFGTANGSAIQPGDYASTSGSLIFTGTAGETRTITVPVVGDSVLEINETFSVNLGAPSNSAVTVADGSGTGTINNDDSASLTIGNRTLAEGNSGSTNFAFTVSLTGAVQGGFNVPFNTANDSATQPSDYASASGNVVFAGSSGETQTVSVAVVGDLVAEADERYFVNLGTPSVVGVTIATAQGIGSIINDDLFADIAVTASDGVSGVTTGLTTTYLVAVTNTSSVIDATTVNITQTASAGLTNISWTCTGSGTATCPASGTGVISQALAIPRSSAVSFAVNATVGGTPPAVVGTTVSAAIQAPQSDPNTANNSATDSNSVLAIGVFADGFE